MATAIFHGLLDVIVRHQLLDSGSAQKAATAAASEQRPFLSHLVDQNLIDS